jgi:cytochrome c oxidase subunit II
MTNWFMSYMPLQASSHAAEIDHMTILVHWLMLVLFVGWGLYYLFVLVRFRKGANPKASYTGAKGKISKGTEVAVAIVEVILLVFYAIPAWAKRVQPMPTDRKAVIVRVVSEQFAWNIHYPGADDRFGRTDVKLVTPENPLGLDRSDPLAKDDITTINQLTLPVDTPVLVHLSSKDVIHSFGLYEMRIKQDAVPGLDIPVWFVPTVTTEEMRRKVGKPDFEYEIACSQLCGLGHFRMRGFVNIKTDAEYRQWLADEAKANSNP